jgi:DNA-binding MarR family transcriptional regulator
MAFVTSIMRAHQLLLARVEEILRPLGLTFARYEVLMLLSFTKRGSLPLGKVGERLQVHPASVTNVIDRLQHDGLVLRIPHSEDRRGVLAEITRPGRQIARDATILLNERVFGNIGLTKRETMDAFRLLRRLRLRAGDFEPINTEFTIETGQSYELSHVPPHTG